MKARLYNLIDTVDAASNEIAIRQAVGDFTRRLGFRRYAYFQGSGLEISTFSNYPRNWRNHYFKYGCSTIDPVVSQAKRLKRAFVWDADSWTEERMPEDLRAFARRAIHYGLRSGLTIPVQGSFGRTLMLTMASSRAGNQPVSPENAAALANAVLAIHYNLLRVADETILSPSELLSPQESLCLSWIAKGQRKGEIAQMLCVAPRTAQEYLDNIRKKLGATTLPQAVAIAKEKKII
jgi:LuxR family transcriptional regulator, activator of conjugal transfer of Ti plasmids